MVGPVGLVKLLLCVWVWECAWAESGTISPGPGTEGSLICRFIRTWERLRPLLGEVTCREREPEDPVRGQSHVSRVDGWKGVRLAGAWGRGWVASYVAS